ncbi:hypothetical protein IC229_30515 [Spirosoma sp. BT702]|uniref:Uncharacterized protein n=1 Tax=Spirosoma profusum TaxID=2771354 RepID=A0A927AV61_9BACT|nr:hypothetical protein [Spirosoma profusum]MBD2705002.1 hypothetical protein [Spirosoma profusum]
MTEVNRKKIAKFSLLTASLAMGMTFSQSFFNEAQASGGANDKYGAVGSTGAVICYCQKSGSNCKC